MLNSNPKSKTGDVDPFDKKKLAEEAKKVQEESEEAKRQEDRRKLLLQISNRERELEKLEADLRVKEGFLVESKRKAEDAKRAVFLLAGQIQKQEDGSKNLNAAVVAEDKKGAVSEFELAKIRTQIDLVQREKKLLETKYSNSRSSLVDLERIITSLKSELDKAVSEADSSKKQRTAEETELKRNRTEKIGNLQRELDRLTVELQQKEALLLETRREVEDAKKAVFLLEEEIKKQESGVNYLSQNNSLRNQSDLEVRVNRLKDELRRVMTEAEAFRKEAVKKEEEVDHKETEEERLAQNYKNLEAVSKQIAGKQFDATKSVQTETKSIKEEKQELFLRKKVAEQLEKDLVAATQVLTILNRDKTAKEREIANLKRERDQI